MPSIYTPVDIEETQIACVALSQFVPFFVLFHHSFAGRSHAIIIFHSMILIRRGENYLSNNSLYVAIKYLDSEYRPIDQIGVRRPLIGRRNVDIDDMHSVWN